MKKYLINRMLKAFDNNQDFLTQKINSYIGDRNSLNILDIGCGNGEMTQKILGEGSFFENNIYGMDVMENIDNESIKYNKIDLENQKFPFEEGFFDVVFSNQVIEHILNKDHMISESHRILKEGGLIIFSTENISSFDNIVSLLAGQEPITQHTGSKFNTNSILSPHYMEKVESEYGNKYLHKNVCSYFGLKKLFEVNGFENVKIRSFGNLCSVFEKIFPIYNRLIVAYSEK